MGVKMSFLQLRGAKFFWNNPFQFVMGSMPLDPTEKGDIIKPFFRLVLPIPQSESVYGKCY